MSACKLAGQLSLAVIAYAMTIAPASAQMPPRSVDALDRDRAALEIEPVSLPVVAAGAGIGWAAGLGAGLGVGYLMSPAGSDSWIGPTGLWVGGLLGGSLGAVLGAHMANERRGYYWPLGILATAAAGATTVYLLGGPFEIIDHPVRSGLALFAVQIGTATLIERIGSAR